MEGKQFPRRLAAVLVVFILLLGAYAVALYDLQVTHYEDYKAQAIVKIATTETVEAARGGILDCYGRSLVTNRLTYQVTLDTTDMKDARDETILSLLAVCRRLEVDWTDTLPVTDNPPFLLTLDVVSPSTADQFTRLAAKVGWEYESGTELMAQLRDYFEVDETLSDAEARALVGVLYELALRSKEITWSDYVFATDVDITFISMVKERGLAGVSVEPVTVRQYNTTSAPHILGRVGAIDAADWETYRELGYAMNETVGRDGVERAFERWLRGTAGVKAVETNTSGKVVSETWITEPSPGSNVSLTIDLALQQKVEESLATYLPTLTDEVEGGACAIVDVNSGAVLALASYPDFDLTTIYSDSAAYNAAVSDPLKPFLNRATMGLYSPGSTFKMVTAVASLEEGIIGPYTEIRDTGIYTFYSDYQPACWIYRSTGGSHGLVNVTEAITVSCNVFFYDVGRQLTIDRLSGYAGSFGLGQRTGIEIGEYQGVVASREYTESRGQIWYGGNVLAAAIGQENNQFTPIQLANYIATLVNGGTRYEVHLLKSVKSHDFSQVLYQYQPTVLSTVDIHPENLEAVKKGMLAVTQSPTSAAARYFADLDIRVGAKTGSAQVSAESESNAVFVCFAPYDDPQIAMAIVAEHGGSGAELGAVAADIISFYFNAQDSALTVTAENELVR